MRRTDDEVVARDRARRRGRRQLAPLLLLAFLCGPALPGPQTLRHQHAGDGHAHVHSDATVRAQATPAATPPSPPNGHAHAVPHGHAHVDSHRHVHEGGGRHRHDDHGHPAAPPPATDTDEHAHALTAGDGHHTHWTAPLQRLQTVGDAEASLGGGATASPTPPPRLTPIRHRRPACARGPPSFLLA
jgi:hypothetical protein